MYRTLGKERTMQSAVSEQTHGVTITQFQGPSHRFESVEEYETFIRNGCNGEELVHLNELWDTAADEERYEQRIQTAFEFVREMLLEGDWKCGIGETSERKLTMTIDDTSVEVGVVRFCPYCGSDNVATLVTTMHRESDHWFRCYGKCGMEFQQHEMLTEPAEAEQAAKLFTLFGIVEEVATLA
jgi:hypothetical protein